MSQTSVEISKQVLTTENNKEVEPAEKADMAIPKVFGLVNADKFLWMITLSLQKDMLSNRGVSVFEMVLFKSIMNTLCASVLVKCVFGESFFTGIPRDLKPALALRSVAGTGGYLCLQQATKYLPLGIITVVCRFNLFTTAALAGCWIGEWITSFEVVAMFISFGGIILIGIAQQQNQLTTEESIETTSTALFNLGIALILGFCIFTSCV